MEQLNGLPLLDKPLCIAYYDSDYKKDTLKSLLVKNIQKDVTNRQFYEICKKFGDIKKCKLVLDYYGESKCYGYVAYVNLSDNEIAKEGFKVFHINFRNQVMMLLILYPERLKKTQRIIYMLKTFL
jgi:polyadenylate-binding protein